MWIIVPACSVELKKDIFSAGIGFGDLFNASTLYDGGYCGSSNTFLVVLGISSAKGIIYRIERGGPTGQGRINPALGLREGWTP